MPKPIRPRTRTPTKPRTVPRKPTTLHGVKPERMEMDLNFRELTGMSAFAMRRTHKGKEWQTLGRDWKQLEPKKRKH